VVSLLIIMYYGGQIDGQNNRNTYLTNQIASLDKQIVEIAELDKKKAGLLRRKQVIEELQASRSQMVHLFDELARTIADGTQITSIQQNGTEMTIIGRAQSNARVSTYMRNLDVSGWMGNPDLSVIELRGADPGLPNEFSLKVTLKNPNDPNAKPEAGKDGVAAAPVAAPLPAVADPGAPVAAPVPAAPGTVTAPAPGTVPATAPATPNIAPTPAPATPAQPAPTQPAPATGGQP
jgi:type IV pilus assembly protein PilN